MGSETEMTLVATKLTAPTPPPHLVERRRLDDAIDTAIDDPNVRVLLVSAPAGSGKSTLIASRLASSDTTWAWLQADEADHDPARFWTHIVAAIARQVPDIEPAVAPAVPSSAMDARPLIERLVNHLTDSGDPLAMVVDDYHLISNPTIDNSIEQLVDLAPNSFTLVLSSRVDPSLRLSRLRVRGQLVEIRADHLRFADDEAALLLGHRGQPPDAHQVEVLCQRTEGWAAGLVLAELSLVSAEDRDAFVEAFRGDDRLVVDYLADEFLSQASDGDRRRYLETSILDEMCGPLIDTLCDSTDGSAWLRTVAETNQLLVGLDRSRHWFRYHHLLRDMLRLEANAVLQVDELHRRAGLWHRADGNLDRAAQHLLAAGDLDDAADVIAEYSLGLLNRGQSATVTSYLDQLGGTVETHTRCCLFRGWIHLINGRVVEAERSLSVARSLHAAHEVDDFASELIDGATAMLHLLRGDVDSALTEASKRPEMSDATMTLVIAQANLWAGRFDDARRLLARTDDLAETHSDLFAAIGSPATSAIVEMESNNPQSARRFTEAAQAALQDYRGAGGSLSLAHSINLAAVHAIIGRTTTDPEDAVAAARKGVDYARQTAANLTLAYTLISAADVLSTFEDPEGHAMLREARRVVDRCVDPGIVGTYLARIENREGTAEHAPSVGLVEDLTSRELAVLHYLPSQLTQRDIANELYVSLNTVRTHCKSIYRKLGVGDRKAAVQAARSHGLL